MLVPARADRPWPDPPRLVAIDVDGTLLTSGHEVTSATRDAVAHVRARGVEVVLASSRGFRALDPVLRTLALTEPAVFVASQGGLTGSCSPAGGLRVLDRRPMAVEDVRPLLAAARAAGIAVNWYAGPHWYVAGLDRTVEAEARIVGVEPEVRDLAAEETGPEKLLLIAPAPEVDPRRIDLPEGLCAQTSKHGYLEVTRADVDKAAALADLCARRGIGSDEVVAFGDGPNDVGLLTWAGTAIAPANARVLDVVDFVAPSNDDDGVAVALRALVP